MSAAACALASLILLAEIALAQSHFPKPVGVWLSGEARHKLTSDHEEELTRSLRRITGLRELRFAEDGLISPGEKVTTAHGSETARNILSRALRSGFVFIIEDHSGAPAVNFGQLDEGLKYEDIRTGLRLLVWRVRLDFQDFREIQAPPEARSSFDVGFTLLHGLGYKDATSVEKLGECEEMISQARAELGLPLRDQYFGDTLHIAPAVVIVRLRFRAVARSASSIGQRIQRRTAICSFCSLTVTSHKRRRASRRRSIAPGVVDRYSTPIESLQALSTRNGSPEQSAVPECCQSL